MRLFFLIIVSLVVINTKGQQIFGSVEFLDPRMEVFFDRDTKIEVLAKGFTWAEGPVWVSKLNGVVFTDVPNNKAYLWTEEDGLSLFLSPSGMTNHAPHSTDGGANGLTLDNEGNLILCQHGNRAISKLKNWGFDVPDYEILVDHFEGKWLNSPNDLVINQANEIFFTDPPYGLKDQDQDAIKELDFNGVYKWSKNEGLVLLDKSLSRPNGIALSNDEKTMYIGNSNSKHSIIAAFDVENGLLKNKRIFFDGSLLAQTRRGLFDGLKVHSSGVIFATGPGGILVLDVSGTHLGTIMPGKSTANCAFDAEEGYLYLTSTDIFARIKIK